MEDYSLSLALFDFLPVLASTGGLWLLSRSITSTLTGTAPPVYLALALIAAGGLSKATWKLLWVLWHTDFALLNNALFILMAPGFILMSSYCHSAQKVWRGKTASSRPGQWALLLILILLSAAYYLAQEPGRSWFFALLAGASAANIWLSSLLIYFCWGRRAFPSAVLFLLSVSLVLALGGLSRFSAGSAPLQWLAEWLNLLAHGSFAYAVWRMRPFIPYAMRPATDKQPNKSMETD